MRYLYAPIFLLLLLLPSVAWAAEPGGPSALSRALSLALELLAVALTPIAVWLAHRAIKVFEDRTKIDVPEAVESQIDKWVERAIDLAEERSRQFVRANTGKLTGPEKLETAANYVLDLARQRGWIEWSKEQIKDRIEAALGARREEEAVIVRTFPRENN